MDKNLKLIPKTLNPLGMQFINQNGQVTGLMVTYDINFGSTGSQINPDIWEELNSEEKTLVQQIFERLNSLGDEIVDASQ